MFCMFFEQTINTKITSVHTKPIIYETTSIFETSISSFHSWNLAKKICYIQAISSELFHLFLVNITFNLLYIKSSFFSSFIFCYANSFLKLPSQIIEDNIPILLSLTPRVSNIVSVSEWAYCLRQILLEINSTFSSFLATLLTGTDSYVINQFRNGTEKTNKLDANFFSSSVFSFSIKDRFFDVYNLTIFEQLLHQDHESLFHSL